MSQVTHPDFFVHTLLRARDWQHRPEFDEVCDWWRSGGRGILALVGMGGAGKTAIIERFLRVLPGGLPEDPDVVRDSTLPHPNSVLVFSFYEAPNPESFFQCLQMWLEHSPRLQSKLSVNQMLLLIQQSGGLIVLDGLEKVQEDGSGSSFGRISSPDLRELLDRVASGYASDLSVVVTSRFPLKELRDARPQFFRTVSINEIDLATGVKLLRDHGVLGSDIQLASIVEECGRHALTVDLAGSYIREYGDRNPDTPLNLGTTEEMLADVMQEEDEQKLALIRQGVRFARIAERYRDAMLKYDEASLALLERVCLFRAGVDCETMTRIFTGDAAEKISGESLASLTHNQVQQKLDWLSRMRIVERVQPGNSQSNRDNRNFPVLYHVHPAVRDGFLSGMGRESKRAHHELVRKHLEVSLAHVPGTNPTDVITLDLLEEIVYHAVEAGDLTSAWMIYHERMGGCKNLLQELNDYARARRLTRLILRASEAESGIDNEDRVILLSDFGYSSLAIGDLAAARQSLSQGLELSKRTRTNIFTLATNLSYAQFQSGHLKSASDTLHDLLKHASGASNVLETLTNAAEADAYRGILRKRVDVQELEQHVGTKIPERIRSKLPRSIATALLGRPSEIVESRNQIEQLKKQYPSGHWTLATAILSHVELLLDKNIPEIPLAEIDAARNWAIVHDARYVLCWCALVQSRIELSNTESVSGIEGAKHLTAADIWIAEGLKIARDSGYGLYHIDLLLQRSRLELLRGNPAGALRDVRIALDEGVSACEATGQPTLYAANHDECGYAWAIPHGLKLRAQAQLLQAAQLLGSHSYRQGECGANEVAHYEVDSLINTARENLRAAIAHWQSLRDPEPESQDQNFQIEGLEYNFRAAETWKILQDLGHGILPTFPLVTGTTELDAQPARIEEPACTSNRFHVALSFPGEHRSLVVAVAEALAHKLTRARVFYDEWYEVELLGAGGDLKLQWMYEHADVVVPFFSKHYSKPWCSMEWETIRGILLNRRQDDAVIPVHLDDTKIPGWSAVNFGIQLRDRTPQQIADLILQALALRKPDAAGAAANDVRGTG